MLRRRSERTARVHIRSPPRAADVQREVVSRSIPLKRDGPRCQRAARSGRGDRQVGAGHRLDAQQLPLMGAVARRRHRGESAAFRAHETVRLHGAQAEESTGAPDPAERLTGTDRVACGRQRLPSAGSHVLPVRHRFQRDQTTAEIVEIELFGHDDGAAPWRERAVVLHGDELLVRGRQDGDPLRLRPRTWGHRRCGNRAREQCAGRRQRGERGERVKGERGERVTKKGGSHNMRVYFSARGNRRADYRR